MSFETDDVAKALDGLKDQAPAMRQMILDMRSECAREVAGAPFEIAKWAGFEMRLASYSEAIYSLYKAARAVREKISADKR
jgi:hypothetical protein